MLRRIHSARRRFLTATLARVPRSAGLPLLFYFTVFAAGLLIVPASEAQQPPPGAIGRVEGLDISVEGGTAAGAGGITTAPSIYVANGSIVTVHSGKAQMTLAAGGQIDICGPAKFTLLQSGDAVTLALSFGRMHVQLPGATALDIFTPTIILTPLDINGGARDVTVGLDVHDSLCVLAASGALRLEHQFSGENLVVPQAGEFFLQGGRLAPVAGAPGTCQCQVFETQVVKPPPPIPGPSAKPIPLAPVVAANTAEVDDKKTNVAPRSGTSVEFSVLAHANDAHPVVPPSKSAAEPAPPPEYQPVYKIMMPPLAFSAGSPAPPEPSLDNILLVRIARVQPTWEFTGKVEAPPFDVSKARPGPAAASNEPPPSSAPGVKPKSGGFWAKLKHLFGGGTVEAAPKPCQGTGCH